ncbi:MAG: vWA domain-containing protein [Acidimicrobiales bacterium]
MEDDLDGALTMLADMTGATDEGLRALARTLAGRVVVDLARTGAAHRRGVGRMRTARAAVAEGDVDVDASLERIASARGEGRPVALDDLTVRSWARPDTALCLVVDRSGSMRGDRLAAAAIAAAAVLYRQGHDCSVIAFSDRAVVVKAQDETRSADEVVGDLLRLRGHGVTDLGLALRAAASQLSRSRAGRRITLLLSDARSTKGAHPLPDASELAALGELAIIAPAGDTADAEDLATKVGGRWVPLAGPSQIPDAVAQALLQS